VELAYMQALMCLLHFPEVGLGMRVDRCRVQGLKQNLILMQRVELAYMQALMCLLHFPEVGLGIFDCLGFCV
jgi:hypothetical protein